jgi:poly(3-hydroxybutyrate) depolymerase
MRKTFWLLMIVFVAIVGTVHADEIRKEKMVSQNKKREYYLYAPQAPEPSQLLPLIVVLHGSGDNGLMPLKRWKDLADQEKIIIAGPNALDRRAWRIPEDAPEPIYEMIEALKLKYPVDPQRVYLFGHSGGAIVALYLALMQSEYFAASAIHAGALFPKDGPVVDRARRKIPFSLFVGTRDPLFPVADLRETRDMLTSRGFSVDLTEIEGHNHNYGRRSDEINKMIWEFFSKHRLEGKPVHQLYNWDNVKHENIELSELHMSQP